MNSRTLFELIGTVDEQMLEHSEWTAPKKRGFKKKALLLAAAVIAALAVTMTAAAVSSKTDFISWIADAFPKSGVDYFPDQHAVQSQLDRGEWVYLNGANIAVIVPESPVKILLSDDGGSTWSEIGNPYSGNFHVSVLTGAGFSTPEIGFISYRYYADFGPDIWWTKDGGDTWQELPVTLPEPYASEEYRFTPQTPTFDGPDGVYPIVALHSWETKEMIYLYSHDYGLTWAFE